MPDLTIDGRALARHRGDPPPADPVAYAYELLSGPHAGAAVDTGTRRAFDAVAAALGAGIGGLVNLHDPDVVTLGGPGDAAACRSAECFPPCIP